MGRWTSRDPFEENWSTGEFNEYAFVANAPVIYLDRLGLQIIGESNEDRIRRERNERIAAAKAAKERKKRIDQHYKDNEITSDVDDCGIEIVWGHTGDANRRAGASVAARVGVLGCNVPQPEGEQAIPGFPDCSEGCIGDADYCSGANGNGGFSPNEGKTQADRQQGFATLLENAINAAFEAASTICQETYNTPPCCKEVVIVLNGVGERDGKDGTRELHRRLKGTTNNLNAPPINGVREGKKWRVPCGNEVT